MNTTLRPKLTPKPLSLVTSSKVVLRPTWWRHEGAVDNWVGHGVFCNVPCLCFRRIVFLTERGGREK